MLSAPDPLECTRKLEWPGPSGCGSEERGPPNTQGLAEGRIKAGRQTIRTPQPPVVMEMWPLCYVHHTAPPALFRVHLGLGQDGGRPPDHRVHTLPFAAKPLNGYSGASHFFTLPASYVVGGTRYGVAAVRGLKTDNSLAGFSVIVSFCILFLWPRQCYSIYDNK